MYVERKNDDILNIDEDTGSYARTDKLYIQLSFK